MSAVILQFPAARKQADRRPTAVAQPLGAGITPPLAGALSPAAELYMDARLERAINDSHAQLLAAQTTEGQHYWFGVMKRLCGLRSVRRIAAMEREKGLR